MKKDIRIYVSAQNKCYTPPGEIFHQVLAGAVLHPEVQNNKLLRDDTGENISEKNLCYCELTTQYWAWKNETADYYGFFHYRRYFSFVVKDKHGLPYIPYQNLGEEASIRFHLDAVSIQNFVECYDVIAPLGEKISTTVFEQYATFPSHKVEDLNLIMDILKKNYPDYYDSAKKYLNSKTAYYCNMFIMKRELFFAYSEWVFSILNKFEEQTNLAGRNMEQMRACGFLGERLFGIYYSWLKEKGNYKMVELPRVQFENTAPYTRLDPLSINSIPIVFSANVRYLPFLGVAIQSIIQNSNSAFFYDIIILHQDFTASDMEEFMKSISEVVHIKIRFVNVQKFLQGTQLFVHMHFSIETYFRFFIPEILPEYQKVLYLDSDLIVCSDIAMLFEVDMDGYELAATLDLDQIGSCFMNQKNQDYLDSVLQLKQPNLYFQAGVLVMNLNEFRKRLPTQTILEVASRCKWRYVDQDVLNHLCQGHIKFLPLRWNVMMIWKEKYSSRMDFIKQAPLSLYQEYLAARKTPAIIHYAGYQKPWNYANCDFSFEFWKYARSSPYYEKILYELCHQNQKSSCARVKKITLFGYNIPVSYKFVNFILPKGSKRRNFIKFLVSKILK